MSIEEFSGGGQVVRSDGSLSVEQKPKPSAFQTAKEVGTGFLKGAGETVQTLVKGGQYIQAGLDPFNTIADYKKPDTFIENVDLEAKTGAEKAGKITELVAEIFLPVGRIAKLGERTKSAFTSLGDEVVEGGVKLKDKVLSAVENLDDKTKTALDRTPMEVFDTYLKQGREALKDDRIRTPLESVGDSVIDGLKQLKDRASKVGEAKSQLLEQAKIGYQKVGNIAQKKALDLQRAFSGLDLDASDTRLIKEFQDAFKSLGDNPRLKDVDAKIDYLQDKIYKAGLDGVAPTTDRVTALLRKELGDLNGQIQDIAGDSYKELNSNYREMIQVAQELNGRLGKEGASAGAFVKRLFSPSDARTKELFETLEKYTGQDYFRDARVAKFIMDTLGDVRGKSLLEQIPDTPTGAIGKGIEFIKDKLSDPIDAAKRFIEKKGSASDAGSKAFGMGAGMPTEDGESFDTSNAALGIGAAATVDSVRKGALEEYIAGLEKQLDFAAENGHSEKSAKVKQLLKALQQAAKELRKVI